MPVQKNAKNMLSMVWTIAGNALKLAAVAQKNAGAWQVQPHSFNDIKRGMSYSFLFYKKNHYYEIPPSCCLFYDKLLQCICTA
jgi:hypothetical protein